MADKTVYFQWQPSSYFGWGIYGLNLLLHTANRPDVRALSTCGVDTTDIAVTPIEGLVMRQSVEASNQVADRMRRLGPGTLQLRGTVLHALGIDFTVGSSAGNVMVEGEDTVGIVFCEGTTFSQQGRAKAARYSRLIAGSSWGRLVLEANGFHNTSTVLQGVDVTNFHPAPKSGLLKEKFVVFSGGKLEYRKGQDIVVRAFAAFAQNHPDAVLLTAWSSPFPELATTLNGIPGLAPVELINGQVDAMAWTTANAVPASQVIHLGPVANADMPRILREADVGLFSNRAEAGTNLVAMEAMACGIPCMLSMNTGHLDIIGDGSHCLALGTQRDVKLPSCDGWGESDVDEIVSVLEALYEQRQAAQAIGQKGAAFIQQLAWSNQIAQLVETIAVVEVAAAAQPVQQYA